MKLDYKRTVYIGLAFFIISMFWVVYDNIIAKMLINHFGLNQTASGFVMALDNIVALFMLPLFGTISDKTHTKYGKRTPYIFWGVILSALFFIGVGIFGTAQQNAVKDAQIPEVVEIIENEEVIGYAYKDQEFKWETGEDKKSLYEYKEEALRTRQADAKAVSDDNICYLIGFLAFLCVVLIIMSIYRTPAVSLMPDVTPKPLRSKANAIINLMGTVAGILCLAIITVNEILFKSSYMFTFILLSVLMVGFLVLFLIKIKEPLLVKEFQEKYPEEKEVVVEKVVKEKMPKDVKRSFIFILLSVVFWFMAYNAATSKFSVYAGNVLNTMFTTPLTVAYITAAIAFIPIGFLASKIGRKKTILIGIVILLVAFLLGAFLTEKTKGLIFVTMGLAGIGWATINVNSYPMVVEMSKSSNIGKYTGYYYTASMAAQIITPVLSGLVMDGFWFFKGSDMRRLFPYSVFFCVLAIITMLFVKHGDAKPIPSEVRMDD
jgi:maltose/moltooligosaccharide transporter